MEPGFISSLSPDELNAISPLLLQDVLDIVPAGIQVLRAIRDKNNEIIDLEYVLLNQVTNNKDRLGKTFLGQNPQKKELFEHLVKEMDNEHGNESTDSFTTDGNTNWYHIKYKKFGDGILLSIEDITQIKILKQGSQENLRQPVKSVEADRDITEQVQLEEKIDALNRTLSTANHELATANLELQTFSSIAANDYKETLKHLYTSLEYITTAEAANLSHTGRANIRRSQAAIQKMKLLTEDIILYSSIQNLDGNETIVDLMKIFETIKKQYDKKIKEEDIRIDCNGLPVVKGHPHLLLLMFRHLVDNALKFNHPGNKTIIHINCTRQEAAAIRHPAVMPGKKYDIVSITDNGHGFKPEQADDIFKMFYRVPETKNHKGSGMGLAICKKIMDIHKGFITAESIPDNGASFYCYFPVNES